MIEHVHCTQCDWIGDLHYTVEICPACGENGSLEAAPDVPEPSTRHMVFVRPSAESEWLRYGPVDDIKMLLKTIKRLAESGTHIRIEPIP